MRLTGLTLYANSVTAPRLVLRDDVVLVRRSRTAREAVTAATLHGQQGAVRTWSTTTADGTNVAQGAVSSVFLVVAAHMGHHDGDETT